MLKVFEWQGQVMSLTSESKLSFLPQLKLTKSSTLKDRLTVVDFEPYSSSELAEIIQICLPDISFQDNCLEEIAKTVRNNARSAVKRSKEISLYCGAKEKDTFNSNDFADLSNQIGILPLGLILKQLLVSLNALAPHFTAYQHN